MGLAILLSAKSCCRLLLERRLHPLHLLGPGLLGCCRLQLTNWHLAIWHEEKVGGLTLGKFVLSKAGMFPWVECELLFVRAPMAGTSDLV